MTTLYPHLHRFATYDFATRVLTFKHRIATLHSHTDAAGNKRTYTEADRVEAQRLVDEVEANISAATEHASDWDRSSLSDSVLIILANDTHMFTAWAKKH